jgi:hypothetical protein
MCAPFRQEWIKQRVFPMQLENFGNPEEVDPREPQVSDEECRPLEKFSFLMK